MNNRTIRSEIVLDKIDTIVTSIGFSTVEQNYFTVFKLLMSHCAGMAYTGDDPQIIEFVDWYSEANGTDYTTYWDAYQDIVTTELHNIIFDAWDKAQPQALKGDPDTGKTNPKKAKKSDKSE